MSVDETTYQDQESSDDTTDKSYQRFDKRAPIAKQHQDELLKEVRSTKGGGKWPTKDAGHGEPGHTLPGLQTAPPVHKRRSAKHGHIHGEAGRQEGGTRMKVSGAHDGGYDEEDTNPSIES
ncbi:hypothetical protein MKX07_002843 [Trichoderma sp. CBMAI-0711]|nr:hypothetical protein MKX07_002843 [Trichoderma sp. CBMAI-0711]